MRAEHLEVLHRLAHRYWMKHTSQLGMSYSEFEYLSAIYEQAELAKDKDFHGQHLHDIVRMMGVNKASASAMMDKLEKRKLVKRKPCKKDARAQHIVLTAKGDELRQAGKAAYAALETAAAELGIGATPPKAANIEPGTAPAKAKKKAEPKKVKEAADAAKQAEFDASQLTLFG
ncbi:MarR family winged helix-turn-helix transcriptional regulator [Maritalea mediterranea]|uniref:MarR family transcriptional regulator n=1 Tax=Maritalea mediterranea TaxID=2909667 RepID=A0ABS9E5T6_9HYPH|nr:MarR family transcriptional regulator [Maritalea mediterranea]MCF4098225.1 MarR family transcriptional regulator [Maritalea mediterranea]